MDSLPSFLGWTEFIRGLTLNRGWTELVHGRARRDLKQLVRRLAVSGLDDAQISQWQNDLRARSFPSSQLRDDDGFPWDGSEDGDYVEMACYGPQGVVLPSHVRLLLNETNGSSAAKEDYSTTTANVLKPLADWKLVSSVAANGTRPATASTATTSRSRPCSNNKLLREWEWAEVPPGEISPTFRELYKEHVGDRYGDADGSSRGRTVATPLFGDPNALV